MSAPATNKSDIAPIANQLRQSEEVQQLATMLKTDPTKTIKEVFDLIGLPADDARIDELVTQTANALKPLLDAPNLSAMDAVLVLMALKNAQAQETADTSITSVERLKTENAQLTEKRLENLAKQLENLKSAEKAGDVQQAFGWIAIAVIIIVGVVTCPATGGTSGVIAGILLAAAVGVMIGQQADPEGMSKVFVPIFGDSKETRLGTSIFWTAVVIVCTLGSGAITTAALKGGSAAIKGFLAAGMILEGGVAIGSGASTIMAADANANVEEGRAEALKIEAFIKLVQAAMEHDTAIIEEMLEKIQEAVNQVMTMLDSDHKTKNDITKNIKPSV